MILEKIVVDTEQRVQHLKKEKSLVDIKKQAEEGRLIKSYSFYSALKGEDIAMIAEVKRASPSKGMIDEKFDYLQIATDYVHAGVKAISVLTEPFHFLGRNEYVTEIKNNVAVPILRKDFIIDEYQVYEAFLIGADAILLIASILEVSQMKEYMAIAKSLSMDCLVEAHNEKEVEKALLAGAEIIGVNNRDLRTFQVDIHNSLRLRAMVPANKLFVSESGIKTNAQIKQLRAANVNGVLIGETLMTSSNKASEIKELLRIG